MHPDTKGFFLAIHDEVIKTRNYEKQILKLKFQDRCRKCNVVSETIEPISGACQSLPSNTYLGRGHADAGIIQNQIPVLEMKTLCYIETSFYFKNLEKKLD